MDLMLGGDLKFHLINAGRFTEKRARFYAAEVRVIFSYVMISPDFLGSGAPWTRAHPSIVNCLSRYEARKRTLGSQWTLQDQ